MKVNLKQLEFQINSLDMVRGLKSVSTLTTTNQDLRALYNFLVVIKTDLEMAGESIVELDKERLAAIKERDGVQS